MQLDVEAVEVAEEIARHLDKDWAKVAGGCHEAWEARESRVDTGDQILAATGSGGSERASTLELLDQGLSSRDWA